MGFPRGRWKNSEDNCYGVEKSSRSGDERERRERGGAMDPRRGRSGGREEEHGRGKGGEGGGGHRARPNPPPGGGLTERAERLRSRESRRPSTVLEGELNTTKIEDWIAWRSAGSRLNRRTHYTAILIVYTTLLSSRPLRADSSTLLSHKELRALRRLLFTKERVAPMYEQILV